MNAKLVEVKTVERDYGITGHIAIVDTEKHGRLLIQDGFGGVNTLAGGTVRWRHGIVCQLRSDDTLTSLENGEWNNYINHLQAVCAGYDNDRPFLPWWTGGAIEALAKAAGL